MTPQELASAIEALVSDAADRYKSAINSIQNKLYDELVLILKGLELDSEGYIKQSSSNRKILNSATEKISEAFGSSKYTNSINNYISVIPKVDILNVKYFTAIEETFKPNRIFLKSLQADTIATLEKDILRDGLQSQVINPLRQILNQNVNSGGKFSGFLEQIKTYINGNDQVDGRAMSYTKTYLTDTLFTYSRTFQAAITSDLGLVWYRYSGGLVDRSRPFCVERNGKYFHEKEIESWASLDWAGKKQGTTKSSIFIYAGGYFCGHQLIPVSESIVPKSDLDRIN